MGSGLVRLILIRLAQAGPLLVAVSLIVFALIYLAPGDPVRTLLGAKPVTPEAIAVLRERYNLEDPFIVQYLKWLWQMLQGDLGRSISGNRRVINIIAERLSISAFLAAMSAVIVLGAGIGLGAWAALRRGSWIDRLTVTSGVLGISSPPFVTGLFLLYLFGVILGWFPTFGAGANFLDRLWHLTLPAIALAFSVMAIVMKITRAAMIEAMVKDYVTFARARGLSARRVLLQYVLRNALIPVITAAGLVIVSLVAGSIYVEVTFALPGLGTLMVDAVSKRDIPLIQGTTLVFSLFVVVANLLIDILYTFIDPRIRFEGVKS
ncbi:ABC transporter permease [Mesorhizobium sp.]|uniref:ABC transporter permease n=3 Tax=Mesorhizobium sp. TaxID=1871066 RepID=UPI000FE42AEE|nr:ABC transporter permease [Mesorhizobium sp.]RWH67700.1 MAG: ABC transporter permease [Mesorhizobium sp.]RWL23476.1 MAG: ABC transporter permease [Mesorhizobium sp.]RWL25237.1 MAG: ABC transporter permease [Mesorhizobium sp.]RWL33578.1 MAG: ABC transporter permease [Mesorhizobium sp.]RWL52519.1 MAG: ABC transporter permease [Mesorhizobium sp.]